MSNKKYYLGKIIFSKEDTGMEEEWNVLYCTAKKPQEVLALIAKHVYEDGKVVLAEEYFEYTEISPVKDKDDWWVFADGYMSLAYSYHVIKKSTYEDLQGKMYTDNNHS